MRFLGRYAEPFYAVLRIVSGFLFACHGAQKLFGALGGQKVPPGMTLPFWAGVIELVGGVLILLGLFTEIAALVSSGEMAVAYFMVHQPNGGLPIQNQGELAALYAFLFLYIAARGGGLWSLDAMMRGGRRRL